MTATPRAMTTPTRWLLQGLAALCVLLGLVGVFVPIMPTVPFLIVAAWCASRSSPRLHQWLITHRHFGRELRAWEEHGVVPRRAKWFATVMMAISGGTLAYVTPRDWLALVLGVIAVMIAIGVWLWRRPERQPAEPA